MLASCCDLIIAAEDALFADPAVRWGGAHVSTQHAVGAGSAKGQGVPVHRRLYRRPRRRSALGLVNRVVTREELAQATLELAQRIALQDPYALKLAKASVNETLDIQGQRRALESAFKNYMLTIPHPHALGTYGAAARARV